MFEKLIRRIAEELDKDAIPYMIIGGQAVLLYGRPRLTRDIEDVRHLLAKNRERIDVGYVRQWLSEFGELPECHEVLTRFEGLWDISQ